MYNLIMTSFSRLIRSPLFGLLALLLAACTPSPQPLGNTDFPYMQARPLSIASFHLFDIGVTDINGDGVLDIFTANHSARQSFLPGDGQGEFGPDHLETWGLWQSQMFPGLEDSDQTPSFTQPGLYIFWRESRLVLHSWRIGDATTILGRIDFYTPIEIDATDGFVYEEIQTSLGGERKLATLNFQVISDGELIITPLPRPRVGSPIAFAFDDSVLLNQIHVGQQAVSPERSAFMINLQDRHGLAWHNILGDDEPDLLIAGGANLGMTNIPGASRRTYEFFQQTSITFHRLDAAAMGLDKRECPARQISFNDVNGDGLMDVYVVCIRQTPNQLFMQGPAGRFTDIAATVGLDMPEGGVFAWLDVNDDGRSDLLWGGEDGFWLYTQVGDHFIHQKLDGPRVWTQNLALGDFDGDGDGDVFVASRDANLFYENRDGRLTYIDPVSVGLPKVSLTASWVDFDNDGLPDLFTLPGGFFRQRTDHHFEKAFHEALSDFPSIDSLRSARAVWFDADNDGFRDVVFAMEDKEKQWRTAYYHHLGNGNHWLEVVLHGPAGLDEAVGARVMLYTDSGQQSARMGWSEDSHYGQGHYRLYFGLGRNQVVKTLTVIWPDGFQQVLTQVPADQILNITYGAP